MAAARSLADSGIGKALPKLNEVLAGLPARIKAAAIERGKNESGGDHRSPSALASNNTTLDTLADALSQDLPGTNWRDGQVGVLDASWAADADLLPELLPIAITGAHAGFDGNHRTATFEAASDAQLLALGVGQADLANIRAGLKRSPHHAALAIDDAFARLDPNSDMARAAQAELTASSNSPDDGGATGKPTITVQPDGSFRVDDADGNEVGTATTPQGAQKLADASANQSGSEQTTRESGPQALDRGESEADSNHSSESEQPRRKGPPPKTWTKEGAKPRRRPRTHLPKKQPQRKQPQRKQPQRKQPQRKRRGNQSVIPGNEFPGPKAGGMVNRATAVGIRIFRR